MLALNMVVHKVIQQSTVTEQFLDPCKRAGVVRLFELDRAIGSQCGHWRHILIPGVNVIGLKSYLNTRRILMPGVEGVIVV